MGTRRYMSHRALLLAAAVSVALIAAACGEGAADTTGAPPGTQRPGTTAAVAPPPATEAPTTTVAKTTTTVAETTTTQAEAIGLPDTPSTATLGDIPPNTYKMDMATFTPLDFDPSELPAEPGTVTVRWYTYMDRYVYALDGFDPSTAGPLCPGASILTTNFEDVSNAPTEPGACEGFLTLTDDPLVGPRICQGTLLYVTLVPSSKQGTLFGTLEALAEPGVLVGLTSQADSAGATAFDVDAFCA